MVDLPHDWPNYDYPVTQPRYPIYVPTKGRWQNPLTIKCLLKADIPFYAVVEPDEVEFYSALVPEGYLLVLPESGKGLFESRNFIKRHSMANGDERHWQLDDNIREMQRLYKDRRLKCPTGPAIRVMEDFTDRYENISVSGPNYVMFGVSGTMKPFSLNAHVYSACVAPETPILCADLIWRQAGTLRPGQRIVAFDEEPNYQGQGKNARSYRTAIVQANEAGLKPSCVVRTDIGDPVVASVDHPWLVLRDKLQWVETRDLRIGDQLAYLGRPWVRDETHDAGWMAGLWDGEGWLTTRHNGKGRGFNLGFAQKPGAVLDRAKSVLTDRGFAVGLTESHGVAQARINGGFGEALRFAGEFAPTRLIPKMPALWESTGVRLGQSFQLATVVGGEYLGEMPVASIQTSTGTFVTGGYLSHNTLVNNAVPIWWRLLYNDDTDYCLQSLATGWCTVLVNVFLAYKLRTMIMGGGNTDDLYQSDGRLKMARMLERYWPGVVATDRRWQRPQHVVSGAWKKFDTPLKLKPGIDLASMPTVDEYGLTLKAIRPVRSEHLLRQVGLANNEDDPESSNFAGDPPQTVGEGVDTSE